MLAVSATAEAETRSLKLFYTHTGETAEITFKRNGRYDQDGLNKLNRFLRDWRRNEPTKMDPRLFDLVWEVYRASGARNPINIVSAYRSPATNNMLRSRSRGVAEKSQHMLGKAMDFYIPGVPLKRLRELGLKMGSGGVGYYPTSGSPFVHMDVGSVRHWPRMSRKELLAVFPNGGTMHVPTDGKPLPGYEQALAAYKSRKGAAATLVASNASRRSGGFLSAFFGGGADEEEEASGAVVASSAFRSDEPPIAVAKSRTPPREVAAPRQQVIERAAPPVAAPAIVEEKPEPTPETIIASLPSRAVPLPGLAPRPKEAVGAAELTASIPAEPQPAATEAATEMALNVPLPTRRPKYTPTEETVVVASAAQTGVTAGYAVPSDDASSLEMAKSLLGQKGDGAPLPSFRPGEEADGEAAPVVMAAFPSARPDAGVMWPDAKGLVPSVKPSAGPMVPGLSDKRDPQAEAAAAKMAALAATAPKDTPRLAIIESGNPAAAAETGTRTTAKTSKPRRGETKPEPKPVVLPVDTAETHWAIQKGGVALPLKTAERPSLANQVIRTAPTEVIATGFTRGPVVQEAQRFTGKAVTFLAVAKFQPKQ